MSGVKRSASGVEVAVSWDDALGVEWDDLGPTIRNTVRRHADLITDMLAEVLPVYADRRGAT